MSRKTARTVHHAQRRGEVHLVRIGSFISTSVALLCKRPARVKGRTDASVHVLPALSSRNRENGGPRRMF
jgi:hypothetical protein